MNIAFFTGFTSWPPHYETELELLQRHIDANDSVTQVVCNGEMLACEANPYHTRKGCSTCVQRRKTGTALLSARPRQTVFLKLTSKNRQELNSFSKRKLELETLKSLQIENFDIGYAVTSSVTSITRDDSPNPNSLGNLPKELLLTSLALYRSFQNLLDESSFDIVYVFNGRFATTRAVLRACQSRNTKCVLHERGHDLKHFSLYDNALPHDINAREREIIQAWKNAENTPEIRESIGKQFFHDRAKGVIKSWYSFTSAQSDGTLPEDWDASRRNIAIFNSSEDEFASIGDQWSPPIYANQEEGIAKIAKDLNSLAPDVKIYLRIHPNLRQLKNSQSLRITSLDSPNLTIIPPESPVSTYTLLKNAEKVITFGSTTGIEATFWGKPSISLGKSFYYFLDATYTPQSHNEALDLIIRHIEPKNKEKAIIYGHYMNTFGEPFKYFNATGVIDGTFKGQSLVPRLTPAQRVGQLTAYHLQRLFNAWSRLKLMRTIRLP